MRVQGSGSATWLILFVLGVAAVVGVFGMPQFAPVIASSEHVSGGDQLSGDIVSYQQAGAGESMAQGVEDLFASFDDAGSSPAQASFQPLDVDRLESREPTEPRIANLFGRTSRQSRSEFDQIAMDSRSNGGGIADRRDPKSFGRDRNSPANEHVGQQFSADQSDGKESDERSNRREFDSQFGRVANEISTASAEFVDRNPKRERGARTIVPR
jgi:hypothetical protein